MWQENGGVISASQNEVAFHENIAILYEIEKSTERIRDYNNQPIAATHLYFMGDMYENAVYDILFELAQGITTPRNAAQDLHNLTVAWFNR